MSFLRHRQYNPTTIRALSAPSPPLPSYAAPLKDLASTGIAFWEQGLSVYAGVRGDLVVAGLLQGLTRIC